MAESVLPVLVWRLAPDLYVGRRAVCDAEEDVARSSASGVIAALKQAIEKGEDEEPVEDIDEVRLVRFTVPVRPKEEGGKSAGAIPLSVDVVQARLENGVNVAEIVPFRHVFRYLDEPKKNTLQTLVEHFVREEAGRRSVDALFSASLLPVPTLETAHVPRRRRKTAGKQSPQLERLGAVAERVTGPATGAPGTWERQAEIQAAQRALEGRGSLILVGPPRVGKSAVLLEAVRLSRGKTPVFRTRAQRLVAGAKYLGEWQEQCEQLVKDLREVSGVLWVEDLPALLHTGGRGPSDSVAAYLRPALDEGLRLMGEVTPAQLEAMRGKLPGFVEPFEMIRVGPLAEGAQAEITARLIDHHGRQGVTVDARAARMARRLLDRFVRTEQFPGKLVQFVGEAVARARREGTGRVDEATVVALFTERTGMPALLLDDRLPLDPAAVRAWLDRRIVGQPEATGALVDIVTTFKAGLNDSARPVATVLMAGPTGVGKTATARALAEWCFGTESEALVRVDMSECQHPAQIARLIGSADGEPGDLVRKVRERPFRVVLFDEIEKAHPVFFDSLLSVLDQGTLTDAWGRVTDFRGCVVLLTTNLGARRGASLGFGADGGGLDRSAIRNFFRPELLNRLDRILAFRPLEPVAVRAIAERELGLLAERPGLANRGIQLLYTDAIVDRVVRAGFDPLLGARPLQRVIEHTIVAAVARHLLDRPALGDTVLVVDEKEGEVVVG